MNLLNSKTAKIFSRLLIFALAFSIEVRVRAWEVDFSRRQNDVKTNSVFPRSPASVEVSEPAPATFSPEVAAAPGPVSEVPSAKSSSILKDVFENAKPDQEVVILNTDKGFVPAQVSLKRGQSYKIHIVNVNEKAKNVSFILDAFSEHEGTYFGQVKTINVQPKTDGIFSYVCPETAKQGRIVVFSEKGSPVETERKPASE